MDGLNAYPFCTIIKLKNCNQTQVRYWLKSIRNWKQEINVLKIIPKIKDELNYECGKLVWDQ
jgi:uncharacterized membrane protein SirB2